MEQIYQWFETRGWQPFPFQEAAWKDYQDGYNGIVNAPTGSGKTYSLLMGILAEYMQRQPDYQQPHRNGLQAVWITPIRALGKEIYQAATRAVEGLNIAWEVGIRTGDTSSAERARQKRKMPELLITTPESLHLLMAQKDFSKQFRNLKTLVVDEWHELIGSKRGVQVELAASHLKAVCPEVRIWGISATIGNMEEAMAVLLGSTYNTDKHTIIKSAIKKQIVVETILPDEIEKFPWGGHLGIKLLDKVIPILRQSKTTLLFTNTRAQAEIWYQKLLDAAPELSGVMAMHHGSISRELRSWVEDALYDERLKAVVCTSSLDLGVDFRPVESIIQIGGPKGVARFTQRAGRSGHAPGQISKIFFLPTHALELIEAAALRKAVDEERMESRKPYARSFDVLVQYLVTLAVGEGFRPEVLLPEIRSTFSYESITEDEWHWVLNFIKNGGDSLQAYDDYKKVVEEAGVYKVTDRRIAMRHRLSIGTIASDNMLPVKYLKGGHIGSIEEWFISQLNPGDTFWFAGRNLELYMIKDMRVLVRRSKAKSGKTPSWQGGRMAFSSRMSDLLRYKMHEADIGVTQDIELQTLWPLLDEQKRLSDIPSEDEFLIETFETREGYHAVFFPFEGRHIHEGMASLIGYRLGLLQPISLNIAYNDYGFELLSDQPIPVEQIIDNEMFTISHLIDDLMASLNATELAGRKFRDIASIAGLVFKGFPGKQIKDKHLQASSRLLFEVFSEYDPKNLLLRQAYDEMFYFQLEEDRFRQALQRIQMQKVIISRAPGPTPFAFPIIVDRLREKLTSERLEDRIKKMVVQTGKAG